MKRRTFFAVSLIAIVATLLTSSERAVAQRSADRRPEGPRYHSPVRGSIDLSAKPGSDEILSTVMLKTLANGQAVVEIEQRVPTPPRGSRRSTHMLVVVDQASRQYQTFRLNDTGDLSSNERLKTYIREMHGVDLDKVPVDRRAPSAGPPTSAPLRQEVRSEPRKMAALEPNGVSGPSIKRVRLNNAAQTTQCMTRAAASVTWKDLMGYGVRLNETYSDAGYDYYYDDEFGGWEYSYASLLPFSYAPTYLNTNWFTNTDLTTTNIYAGDGVAFAEVSHYSWNTDFIPNFGLNLPPWLMEPRYTQTYSFTSATAFKEAAQVYRHAWSVDGIGWPFIGADLWRQEDNHCWVW